MPNTLITSLVTIALLAFTTPSTCPADDAGPIASLPWLHEGTVITSHWYTAKLATQGLTFKQDSDGQWMGSDGKNYTKQTHDVSDAGGLIQTTILGIDGDDIALKTTSYSYLGIGDPIRKPPDHNGEPRFLAKTSKNTFCEPPDLLAKEASDPQTGKIVQQVTWPVGDHSVDAVRIEKLSQHEWIVTIFDRKTGIGLHLASVSYLDQGDSILMQYDLVGCRDLHVPWINEKIPQAVRDLKTMRLAGQVVSERGYGTRPVNLSVDFSLDHCFDKWASIKSVASAQLPGMQQPASAPAETRIYGNAEFGGLWIGPAAAAHLQQDQVLDEDPVTKMKTVVSKIDDSAVTITQSNAATTVQSTYDRTTGLLVGTQWFDALTKFRTTLTRQDAQ